MTYQFPVAFRQALNRGRKQVLVERAGRDDAGAACGRLLLNLAVPLVNVFRPGMIGSPSISTIWHPTLSCGWDLAKATASSNAEELAIRVVEVTTPARLASTMARFTPEVSPKSSALTM